MSDKLAKTKETLNAANHASGIVRAMFTGFMGLTAYVIVVIASTDDMQLLRYTPLKLPILNIDINLKGFYTWMPWLYVLLHANLLLLVSFLTDKLFHFENRLQVLTYPDRINFRKQLHVLSFTQYLSGRHTGLLGSVVGLLVWISLAVLPIILLLAMLLDFLPAQEVNIVWNHRIAISVDIAFVLFFWFSILQKQKRSKWPDGWRPRLWRRFPLSAWSLGLIAFLTAYFSWYVALIPLGDRELKLSGCYDLHTLQKSFNKLTNELIGDEKLKKADKEIISEVILQNQASYNNELRMKILFKHDFYYRQCIKPATAFFFNQHEKYIQYHAQPLSSSNKSFIRWFNRNLELENEVITSNPLGAKLLNKLKTNDSLQKNLLKKIIGLPLQKRSLRFANFSHSVLPKANLSNTQMQGINLHLVTMQEANLSKSELQGADLSHAQLQETDLSGAGLQGTVLSYAKLQDANISKAKLQNADLLGAKLQGADLSGAMLQGANLSNTMLQTANLKRSALQGANLSSADLRGALLPHTKLQGADLSEAMLQNADISNAMLQGANLSNAILQDANLSDAMLQGANLSYAVLQNADVSYAILQNANISYAKLQNVDLSYANLDGANFSYAKLHDADLSSTKLQGATLSNAILHRANLSHSELQDANLTHSRLQGINFKYAKLQNANLSGALLQGANLLNAKMQGVDLSYAKLQGADLSHVQLQGANLSHANFEGANLSKVKLQGAIIENSIFNYTNLSKIKDGFLSKKLYCKYTSQFNKTNLDEGSITHFNKKMFKSLTQKPNWISKHITNSHCTKKMPVNIKCLDFQEYAAHYIAWFKKNVCHNTKYGYWIIERKVKTIEREIALNSPSINIQYYTKLFKLFKDINSCPTVTLGSNNLEQQINKMGKSIYDYK